MAKIEDLSGRSFGMLTVVQLHGTDLKWSQAKWLCKCMCGTEKVISARSLKNGTRSCGCIKGKPTRHGDSHTHFYEKWQNMWDRCRNRFEYMDVSVCDRWRVYENFKSDMYRTYMTHVAEHKESNTTLDRINPFDGYSPENCRWATWMVQRHNRRENITCQ